MPREPAGRRGAPSSMHSPRAANRPHAGALAATLALCALCVAPRAPAAIAVEVRGLDSELERNVRALLSLESYKDRDRIEPDAVQRLFRRADGEVRAALRPYGYYEPVVDAALEPAANGRDWRVRIEVQTGEPVLLADVSVIVRGPGASDEVFARIAAAPGLRSGERLQHAAYERVKSDLQLAAATYGYLDAKLLRNELAVDPVAHRASVFLEIETGERYRFGATSIDQHSIRPEQIRRYLRYDEGEYYDETKRLRTQFALDDSQFFSSVIVEPGAPDRVNHIVPVRISASSARNGYSFGAGYGTDTGARGTISWLDPRVNDRGHRLRVQLQGSRTTQNLNVRYDIPFGDPVLEKFSLQFLDQSQQISGNVDTSEVSLRPSVTQAFGHWQRVLSANFAHTITYDPVVGREVDNLVVPGITYASVPEGYLGEELFSRTWYAELIGSHGALGARAKFLRLDLRAERVFNLSERWHLLLRAEAGASAVGNFQELPGTFRFYAGGDRSVRGFAYNELSPTEVSPLTGASVRVGGRHLFTGTVEFERDLPRRLGVAAFTDFGNAFDRLGDPLAVSAGVGLRLRLPVVTFGLDFARAVRAPGFPQLPGTRVHLNISPKL
jgi:translocation and assembly module TamA